MSHSVAFASSSELPDGLADDPRWQLVERIATSESFLRAARLSSFLLYVTRQALAGSGTGLNEQSIGENVFTRPIGYDSREDNIVRAHASRLRQRLETYFATEGAHEPLRVTIPRGSYAPIFERAASGSERAPDTDCSSAQIELGTTDIGDPMHAAAPPTAVVQRVGRRPWLLRLAAIAAMLALLATIAVGLARRNWLPLHAEAAATPTHRLWSQVFTKDRNTLIVPADSSLVLFAELTGHRVSLSDYAAGRYMTGFPCAKPCDKAMIRDVAERRYTSLADLEFAVALARRTESIPNRTQVRYVRDLQLEDFKQSNLILAGSLEADPWLELIENQMDFELQDDKQKGTMQVINRHPHPGEQKAYIYNDTGTQHHGLAAVAFLSNLNGSGSILVVQGFTLADTEAAAEFVTDGKDLDALLVPFARTHATLPHFECLLQTMDVNGISSHPAVLAWHMHND